MIYTVIGYEEVADAAMDLALPEFTFEQEAETHVESAMYISGHWRIEAAYRNAMDEVQHWHASYGYGPNGTDAWYGKRAPAPAPLR